jgi:hypothetical protein
MCLVHVVSVSGIQSGSLARVVITCLSMVKYIWLQRNLESKSTKLSLERSKTLPVMIEAETTELAMRKLRKMLLEYVRFALVCVVFYLKALFGIVCIFFVWLLSLEQFVLANCLRYFVLSFDCIVS